MSCASCVGSVEKALRGVPGVLDVNVNLATERANVEFLAGAAEVQDFERSIEEAGYGVVREQGSLDEDDRGLEYRRLRRQFLVAVALTVLVVMGSLPMMLGVEVPLFGRGSISCCSRRPSSSGPGGGSTGARGARSGTAGPT
jgi:Cu+-exporting ATPase